MEYITKKGRKIVVKEEVIKTLANNYRTNVDLFLNSQNKPTIKYWVNRVDEYDVGSFVYNSLAEQIDKADEDIIVDERFLNRYYKNLAVEADVAEKQIIPHFAYETVYVDKFIEDYLE